MPASTRPLSCSTLANRTGLVLDPSIPLASSQPLRPEDGLATPVSVSESPSRFPGESAEYDRRTAAGTWQTSGRGAPLLPRASLRQSPPPTYILRAPGPQTPRQSALLHLRLHCR